MIGSLGGFELLLLAGIALLVFGPKRLPELGRSLAKGLVELRRVTSELKSSIEEESGLGEVTKMAGDIRQTISRESTRFIRSLEADVAADAGETPPAAAGGEEREGGPPGTSAT